MFVIARLLFAAPRPWPVPAAGAFTMLTKSLLTLYLSWDLRFRGSNIGGVNWGLVNFWFAW